MDIKHWFISDEYWFATLLLLLLILKNIPDFNGILINTVHTLMVALDVIVSEACCKCL